MRIQTNFLILFIKVQFLVELHITGQSVLVLNLAHNQKTSEGSIPSPVNLPLQLNWQSNSPVKRRLQDHILSGAHVDKLYLQFRSYGLVWSKMLPCHGRGQGFKSPQLRSVISLKVCYNISAIVASLNIIKHVELAGFLEIPSDLR